MLSRTEASLLRGLRRRRNRQVEGMFLAEGVRVVEELLAAGGVLRLVAVSPSLEDTPRGRSLAASLEGRAPVRRVGDAELRRLAATESPQGILVAAETPRATLDGLRIAGRALILGLDAVQDPGNFGALARCAVAFGAAAIVTLPGTVDPWNPKAVRAAAGASFRLPPIDTTVATLAPWLRERGFALYGADGAGTPVGDLDAAPRAALFVGNEGSGLGDELAAVLDARIAVPIAGPVESLNVAVAAGILLYVLTRSR